MILIWAVISHCRHVINPALDSILIITTPHTTDHISHSHLEKQKRVLDLGHSQDGVKIGCFRVLSFSQIFNPFPNSINQLMGGQKATQGAQMILWVTRDPWATIGCPKIPLAAFHCLKIDYSFCKRVEN